MNKTTVLDGLRNRQELLSQGPGGDYEPSAAKTAEGF
jgi:hypothetical protein